MLKGLHLGCSIYFCNSVNILIFSCRTIDVIPSGCAYCLWKFWLAACWAANNKSRENLAWDLFYIRYGFQQLLVKSSRFMVSQPHAPNGTLFTVSRDAEMWLLVISQCNTLHVSSMTHLQVTGSYCKRMTVAFWKCKDWTWRDTQFWFQFKVEVLNNCRYFISRRSLWKLSFISSRWERKETKTPHPPKIRPTPKITALCNL